MPFVPAPAGVCRVRSIWTFDGGATGENVMYFDKGDSAPPSAGDLTALTSTFLQAWGGGSSPSTHPINGISHDVALTEIDVEDASSNTGPFLKTSVTVQGLSANPTSSPGVAQVVTWYTGLRGRSFRGRTFLAGTPENSVNASGDIEASYYPIMQTLWNEFLSELTNPTSFASGNLVVASFFAGSAPRSLGVVTPVTSSLLRGHVHSQRRRNIRD